MKQSIPTQERIDILQRLSNANKSFQNTYPGERPDRQPIHTVYGGADLFKWDIVSKMRTVAVQTFEEYAPNFVVLAQVLQLPGYEHVPVVGEADNMGQKLASMSEEDRKNHPCWLPYTVYYKVKEKLEQEPLEDFRIDFEDGFGNRSDEEEDQTAVQAAQQVAEGMAKKSLPPFIGIRIKPFTEDMKERGIRTLDLFVSTLLQQTDGQLPANFVVMLPKVTIPAQIEALVELFEILEREHKLPVGSLKMEMMVETTQSIMNDDGKNGLLNLVRSSKGRCIACHFGTYDYTAACNITAKYQDMGHQVCDFAHHMTKVALGGTGIWLSDGATNVMPIPPHRHAERSESQIAENRAVVHKAWQMGYNHIRHSLYKGLYQGWDLHPSQLPMRYTAVYAFFLESYQDAASRLSKFLSTSAQATLTGDVFDDAATGQGLLNYFVKAINCGALTEQEVINSTGLTIEQIRMRSFLKIIEAWKHKNY